MASGSIVTQSPESKTRVEEEVTLEDGTKTTKEVTTSEHKVSGTLKCAIV